jgi:hypothetical protein
MPPARNEMPSEAHVVGTADEASPAADDKPDGKLTMDGFARWVLSAVDPDPARVPYLRHQAGLVLHLWRLDDVAWTVELLLTELASNVVRHARTLFNVGMVWDGHTLRGEVTDANPVPRTGGPVRARRHGRTRVGARRGTRRPLGLRRALPRQDRVVRDQGGLRALPAARVSR